jgi:RHS repeat-associated protein
MDLPALSFSGLLCLSAFLSAALLPSSLSAQSWPHSKVPLANVLGQPRSVQVSQAFGVLTDTVPIIVPPGRHDVEPHLSLAYSSGGPNGMLGVGWDLNLGYIELDRLNGLPTTGDADSYDFSFAGLTGELYSDGVGIYRQKYETIYREFRKLGNGGWEMRDGQGNRYTFGTSGGSRIDGNLWLLDKTTDAVGNEIDYSYIQDHGAFYPSTILYTGFNGTPGPNRISFSYETRPDGFETLLHTVPEERLQRLAKISVYAGSAATLVRSYSMEYSQDPLTELSLLTNIVLTGSDGKSTIPLRSMGYTTANEGWQQLSGYPNPQLPAPLIGYSQQNALVDTGNRLVDVDGDGCADEITDNGLGSYQKAVYLGDCKGNFTLNAAWTAALPLGASLPVLVPGGPNGTSLDNGVRYMDVNGDYRPDVVVANGTTKQVWLNTYNGYDASTIGWAAAKWAFPAGESSVDPATGTPNCASATAAIFPFQLAYTASVQLKTSNSAAQDVAPGVQLVKGVSTGVEFADVNGDGLPDIVWMISESVTNTCVRAVYLNTGSGWQRNNALSTSLGSVANNGAVNYFVTDAQPNGVAMVDVNGDSRADFVQTGVASQQQVFLYNGSGWQLDSGFSSSLQANGILSQDSNHAQTGMQPVDFNRDGLVDFVIYSEPSQQPKAYRNTGLGWTEDTAIESTIPKEGTFFPLGISGPVADFNGDGVMDWVNGPEIYFGGYCDSSDRCTEPILTPAIVPGNLLMESVGPLGEKVSNITYQRAPSVPIPVFVATQLSRYDRASTTPLTYSYSYTRAQMGLGKFLGFSYTTETEPNGYQVYREYDQRELFLGQLDSEIGTDTTGNLREARNFTRTPVALAASPNIQQGVLSESDDTHYDYNASGQAVTFEWQTEMTYDDRLNLVRVYKNPNVSTPGSDLTTTFGWVRNDDAAIWSLPCSTSVWKGREAPSGSTLINNTEMSYDGFEGCSSATYGLMTSTKDLIQLRPTTKYATRQLSYDQYGNITGITDRNGNRSSFAYDTATSTYRATATDQMGRTINSSFDNRYGAVTSDKDPSGNTTSYTYDPFGRPLKIVKPGDTGLALGTTTYSYSALPAPSTGFSVKRTDSTSNGGSVSHTDFYDAFGQIVESQNSGANGKTVVVTTQYDDAGQPVVISRPYFSGSTPEYMTLTRDILHRVVKMTDPDGLSSTRSYLGLQATETDRRGIKTVVTKNSAGLTTKEALTNGTSTATTQYVYDVNNLLTGVVRADGSTSTIAYDSLGRKVSLTDPNTGTFLYQYDNENHITAVTGPDGKTITYGYDKTGELIQRTYPGGVAETMTYGVKGQTNAVGRVVSVTDAAGTLKLSYDARGRVVTRTRTVTANGKTYVTQYAYDSADRQTSIVYPDGYKIYYGYDGAGNIASVTDSAGKTISSGMTYSASGRLLALKYGNNTSSAYKYDVLDRMQSLTTLNPSAAAIQNLTYGYDADSNVSSIADTVYKENQKFTYDTMNRLTSATGTYGTEAYTYDAIGNLLTKGSTAFLMDPTHPERTTCLYINTPGLYANPAASCAQGAFGTTAVTYDAYGNVAQKGTYQFAYDPENRLITESNSGKVTESNIYDFWGDRVVQKTPLETRVFIDGIYEQGANDVTHHVKTPTMLLATIVQPTSSTTTTASKIVPYSRNIDLSFNAPLPDPTLFAKSTFGASLAIMLGGGLIMFRGKRRKLHVYLRWSNVPAALNAKPFTSLLVLLLVFSVAAQGDPGLLAQSPATASHGPTVLTNYLKQTTTTTTTAAPQYYYYHLNHLGGVNLITDGTGAVVGHREYMPYGTTYVNQGPTNAAQDFPFSYDGQRADGGAPIYYANARFYDPQMGRFLSPDSEVQHLTTPQALPRYMFAGGNPVRYVDPSGHAWWDIVIAVVVILVIVGLAALTGGAAGVALAGGGALLGLGIGAGIAGGEGENPTSESFWETALTGAVIGAGIGAGLSSFLAEGAAAVAADASADAAENAANLDELPFSETDDAPEPPTQYTNTNNALKSVAFGGPQSVLIHELQGGGTDNLLQDTLIGVGTSAAGGVIGGQASSAAKAGGSAAWGAIAGEGAGIGLSATTKFAISVGFTAVVQGGLFTFVGMEKQSLPSYVFSHASGPVESGLVDSELWLANAFDVSNYYNPNQ